MNTRKETDSLGVIEVPKDRHWGAQTQRAIENFKIGTEVFPTEFIKVYAIIKKSAALANAELKLLPEEKLKLIVKACDDVIAGKFNDNFPLAIWQSGSGTQTNMNLNEVIGNRANELAGGELGKKSPIHPNDDVNLSQSTNDTFPTAMHISAAIAITEQLLPALKKLITALTHKEKQFAEVLKIGRTHLQDAVPMTLGQEFGAFAAQLKLDISYIEYALQALYPLAIGATAVGTGLNSHPKFATTFVKYARELTKLPFTNADNKFAAIASHDAIVLASGTLKTLATSLMKIANDIRWLGSGPRCGLGELQLPENEPGSSIMPGKVNPTQCETMTMVCVQVMGNDTAIGIAGSQGNMQLNVFKPIMIVNLLQSIRLLSDASNSFCDNLVKGIEVDEEKLAYYVNSSLMLATALTPQIGYDKATKAAQYAHLHKLTLREAVIKLDFMTGEQFDNVIKHRELVNPNRG